MKEKSFIECSHPLTEKFSCLGRVLACIKDFLENKFSGKTQTEKSFPCQFKSMKLQQMHKLTNPKHFQDQTKWKIFLGGNNKKHINSGLSYFKTFPNSADCNFLVFVSIT